MRTVIEALDNKVVVTRERLRKRPSGDAASRRRQLKHGWQPSWQRCGQPSALHAVGDLLVTQFGEKDNELVFLPVGSTEEPIEIAAAREIVANLKPVAEPTATQTRCAICNSDDVTKRLGTMIDECPHSLNPHICKEYALCTNDEFHGDSGWGKFGKPILMTKYASTKSESAIIGIERTLKPQFEQETAALVSTWNDKSEEQIEPEPTVLSATYYCNTCGDVFEQCEHLKATL